MKEGEFSHMGYILRIVRDEWVEQVFDLKKYYVGVRGRWEPGLTIFFARKAERDDSFLGYGLIENVQELGELSEEERICPFREGSRTLIRTRVLEGFPSMPCLKYLSDLTCFEISGCFSPN